MNKLKEIVVVSGGFDPLHSGHIQMFNSAKTYAHYLIVGINSDDWLSRKKGRAFMPWEERAAIINNLKAVDEVMSFNDSDGTAKQLLEKVKLRYPESSIIFANGGDRTEKNTLEQTVSGIEFLFGIGGDKSNSSSWILEEWKSPKTDRHWGYYRVLHEVSGCKVKELTVDPGKSLSMQRHKNRSEFWMVSEGVATLKTKDSDYARRYYRHEHLIVRVGEWHQLSNNTTEPLKVIEIQYGLSCEETDIERIV